MIFIKIFLIIVLTLSFLLFSFSIKLKNFQIIGVIIGYLTLFIFILNPSLSDDVAHYFSIGTGTALIVYILLAVMSLVSVILFIDTKMNKDSITQIVRKIGIDNAKKC